MDDVDRTIAALCQFPVDYRDEALNLSPRQLVARSGYPSVATQVTVDRIAAFLATRPDLVDAWFQWSHDQRWSPAWWISEQAPGEFRVGYYDPNAAGQPDPLVFGDKDRACAEFALRVIGSIDEHSRRGGNNG
jgi:hypothetical protein